MGLNPPFGVKSALANKFIDKALKFKPKLIALIVPLETERLDKKDPPYDLVFEDSELLAGKSFYLPGSVDVNDKQMECETSATLLLESEGLD
ncbi:Protein ENHANCED DOWNY MILDEW 2 [Orobanche minor]